MSRVFKYLTRNTQRILRSNNICYNQININKSRNPITKILKKYIHYPPKFYYPNITKVPIHSTTILCVRKGDDCVMMGDGQMTIGNTVGKNNAKKLRKLSDNKIMCGFAGAAADGIALVM